MVKHLIRRAPLPGMLALLLGSVSAPPAQAFAEDVCPAPAGVAGWGACSLQLCLPGSEFIACGAIAMATTFVSQATRDDGARSTVHFDASYYLAQAAGLTPRDAYMVAAYSQVPDVGQYLHRDQAGELMADPAACGGESAPPQCLLNTLRVDGMERNNFESGGVFYHFMAPFAGAGDVAGLAPQPDDPLAEPQLNHVRRWLYGGGPLCVAGLTAPVSATDYANGASCYQSSVREKSELLGRIPFVTELGYLGFVDWLTPLGEQTAVTDPVSGTVTPASALDAYFVPEQAPLVRLGLYLHALSDRISHHRCNLASSIQGPRAVDAGTIVTNPLTYPIYQFLLGFDLPNLLSALVPPQLAADPEFFYEFDIQECDQLSHANRHTWETGVEQDVLATEDQTTAPALAATLEELEHFREFYLLPAPSAIDATNRAALLEDLLSVLETPTGAPRFSAFCEAADRHGWLPLPGYCGLTFTDWDAKAGSYSLGSPGAQVPSGGASCFAPLLLAALFRRRLAARLAHSLTDNKSNVLFF